jgi:hypothetical protein
MLSGVDSDSEQHIQAKAPEADAFVSKLHSLLGDNTHPTS